MSRGLGEILVKIGVIDRVQLAAGMSRLEQWGGHLLTHLVQARMVEEETLVNALGERFKYETAHPLPLLIEREVLDLLPGEFCAKFLVLPIAIRPDETVLLAVSDPSDLDRHDSARAKMRRKVAIAVAGPQAISDAVGHHYFGDADRIETPEPFASVAGEVFDGDPSLADSLGEGVPADGGIELPPDEGMALELDSLDSTVGDRFPSADDVAPRPVTGDGYLSDTPEVVDVGDIFADHSAPQPEAAEAGEETKIATPGLPADEVETKQPDLSKVNLGPGNPGRGIEMPTAEVPRGRSAVAASLHPADGGTLVVAAKAVSKKAVEDVEAQKEVHLQAQLAVTEAIPVQGDGSGTALFERMGGAPPAAGSASPTLSDAPSISPHLPHAEDVRLLKARCQALENQVSLLMELLVDKGVIDPDDL